MIYIGSDIGFKICFAMFDITTAGRGYWAEQLACSTAEGSGMCVGVQ